jgi:hypothetical protein
VTKRVAITASAFIENVADLSDSESSRSTTTALARGR